MTGGTVDLISVIRAMKLISTPFKIPTFRMHNDAEDLAPLAEIGDNGK